MQSSTPNTTTPESPFIRGVANLAAFLGVSEKSIARAMRKHLLPYVRFGGSILFRKTDVDRAIERLSVPAVGTARARKTGAEG